VLRVVARLNVGGAAHQVGLISEKLDPARYQTLLVHGRLGAGEASFEHLARGESCVPHQLDDLGPAIDPRSDARALRALVRLIREFQPDIVDTHTAKAGFLGRLAARLSGRPRPIVVHTYHGHVLEGYFGRGKNALYRTLERSAAAVSDLLLAPSQATVDDLVRLGVAPRERFRVLPYGLELDDLLDFDRRAAAEYRRASGVEDGELLLGYVGRLVPIKRVDVILRAFATLREAGEPVKLSIAGDGELRPDLERLAADLGVADAVRFHGYVTDVPAATAAADIAVLSSDNEGTPVALIEAGTIGVPAVATTVGGVTDVVPDGCGLTVPPGEPDAFAAAVQRLLDDPAGRAEMAERARRHVIERYSVGRMLDDLDNLYAELLHARPGAASGVDHRK
jgi:glycosyltransferase involved in cell wall biosynthesis